MAVQQRTPQPRRRRPKAGPRSTLRRPPGPKLLGRPEVIVLGLSEVSKRVVRAIRRSGTECRRLETPAEADASIYEQTKALVIVPPIPSFSVSTYLRRRRPSLGIPVFVVLQGPLPARSVRTLYSDGVKAIFEWPVDAAALERSVFRVAAPSVIRWGRRKEASEVALEELVRARLKAHATRFGAKLALEVRRRFVVLKGSVDSLWKLELAQRIASEVPGVADVVGDAVKVVGEPLGDRAVSAAVRAVLRHASAIDESTLAVSVRDGEVTLTGSAEDKQELARTVGLISHVRGVRRIDNYVSVSAKAKKQDRTVARSVREALGACYPDSKIEVTVFGGIAVLSGRVPRASVRGEMIDLVYSQEGVARVVDKMAVATR